MSNPVLIAFQNAWADTSLTKLVPDGNREAAMLVAPKGIRVEANRLARFSNVDEFFMAPEAYHQKYPVANPILFVPAGEAQVQPLPEPEVAEPVLNEGNSVVVNHLGDVTQDVPDEEPEAGVTSRRNRRR